MSELSPEDRYQLRKLQMDVDKKGLEVQKSQQDLDRLVLELEHKYGLLGGDGTIDPKSGTINGFSPVRNGKSRPEHLSSVLVEEAA
ncbi:MAG: hypothetical protein O2909_00065 [Chloroflexi bacterium]|nr:hypothetical protein [Chloroflexota bacterium]MDA1217823.1 hypothetical protein [Chloroflexota bacterium]